MSENRTIYQKKGRVAYITINRPQVLNALDLQVHKELCEIWNDFEQDNNLRVAVLTGAGHKAFSVGQDLKELRQRTEGGEKASSFGSRGKPGYPRLTERFNLSKPVIAKVNGYAFGGGFELALACDIIIASENACFSLPEAKLGLIAGAGGVFRLTRQIPYKIAMGYLITGRKMDAARAYELGLVNQVTHPNELDSCVEEWVKDILDCAPLSVKAIKQAAMESAEMTIEESFQADYMWENKRINGQDCIEGPTAFLEKRSPVWKDYE